MGKERASSEQAWTDVLERERGASGGGERSPQALPPAVSEGGQSGKADPF